MASHLLSQDAKWDLNHWGQEGDFFFPHVYETNQDPNSADGTNPVGRWDWGPWFWPVFPAQMSLPSGEYGDGKRHTGSVHGHAHREWSALSHDDGGSQDLSFPYSERRQ